jgi:methionyl-tRNA synthetase
MVTAALPYSNGPIHIGHLSGVYLSADIFVRFLRMLGKDVVFVCGSDEHGAAITIKAKKEGLEPQQIIDKYHAQFEDTFKKIGISFDIFHRTSSALHHETAQDFFLKLYKNGEFVERETEQYFDEEAQQFLADRYITGTCPKCGFENAYGDQCEKCGSTLNPTDLINPRSTLSGATPVLKATSHWYLPLDKYQSWLDEWITTGKLNGVELHDPADWKAHVIGQCKSWLDGGLEPRAMTRDLDWGVDVPMEIPGAAGKKLYVWLDAPIGYISATKQWAKDNNKDWEKYWKNEESALIHFLGKDNIVFHCLIFPGILHAHGEYILPLNVPANQFMNLEGNKISTSRNWAVWVHEYLKEMPGREDELRYYLTKNMPEQKDSEFTWKGFQEVVNTELVNNLANFFNRVVVLTNKYYKGVVPDFDLEEGFYSGSDADEYTYMDSEIVALYDMVSDLHNHIMNFDFRAGLKTIMEISSLGNQLLQFNEPWKYDKVEPERVAAVMNFAIQITAVLAIAVRPFLPFTSKKMHEVLGMDFTKENGVLLDMMNSLAEGEPIIPQGHQINEPIHLFSRITDDLIEFQMAKLENSKVLETVETEETAHKPLKPEISYEEFQKMDIRTGTIISAEKMEKADKLLMLSVDLGFEVRTIVSGIAMHFKPEEIIGKQVTVLANLAPRKLRGVESKGMILMAEDATGKLMFINPDEDFPTGMTIQ